MRYFGDFGSAQDVLNQWNGANLTDAVVIAAVYHQESYEGDAMIVYRKEGKLYEVHDSHCSCNGLDNWNPEETTYEALSDRLSKTHSHDIARYGEDFAEAIRKGLVDEAFEREILVK